MSTSLSLVGCATSGPSTPVPTPVAAAASAAVSRPAQRLMPASLAASAASGVVGAPAQVARPAAVPASASAAATPAPGPGAPPPFALVIKDAQKTVGLFTVWQRDERVWIELQPSDLNQPFFLSPKIASGIGEGGVIGGLMAGSGRTAIADEVVAFRRIHNLIQLVVRNVGYTAKPGTPAARAVESAFSDSLLGSAPVASQPHPESKAILIEANGLFLSDLLGIAGTLQRNYRQGYGLDGRNSAITGLRGKPDQLVIETLNHFASPGLALPAPGTPVAVPGTLTDPRSLFVRLHYSLSRLPAQPMVPRRADGRIGHFATTVNDLGDELARSPRQRFVNRWRLEKKDPAAAVSEPVKPITYWLDRNIPEAYRAAITTGVLAWNEAFERIGFRNAIVVKQQPDDAAFDTLDEDVASIRWMTNAASGFGAIGPSHVDPRTGEILDADVGIESSNIRGWRSFYREGLGGGAAPAATRDAAAAAAAADWAQLLQVGSADRAEAAGADAHASCEHAAQAGEQLGYLLEALATRDGLPPDSPEAQQFVLDYLTEVSMHEVGHTLGLRHNFRASRVYSQAQLNDPVFTREHSFSGSVMEYNAINLAAPGQPQTTPFQRHLGPYDFWAIEYAYKPLAADAEATELARIAARSSEPALAYGSDEDSLFGVDPEVLMFDLGDDPLAFARQRFALARDLIARQETRVLPPEGDYASLRRTVGYALRDAGRAAGVVLRQVGGLRTLRDRPGSGRDPMTPVPAAQQRAALAFLADELLAPGSLAVSPALQRRLAPDYNDRGEGFDAMGGSEFVPQQGVLALQRALVAQLISEGLAARVLDGQGKVERGGDAFKLSELYQGLEAAVWQELRTGKKLTPERRDLQRDHADRLSAALLRPAGWRPQARALMRDEAQKLQAELTKGLRRSTLSAETRAHWQDAAESLQRALGASMLRATP
ncbi:MAG: hypothetical protein RJA98_1258 [Pseudomonadota bacterium]